MSLLSTTTQPVDVLVVGAGPVGLATALWFGQEGYRVILVEQYGLVANQKRRAFNERHQQVGLDPTSLDFLKELNTQVFKEVAELGCPHNDWINITIFSLQNILFRQISQLINVTCLFGAKIEAVSTPEPTKNARVIVAQDEQIFSFYPEVVVICDGKHNGSGTAKKFFDFSSASRVTLSSSGIIGMIRRQEEGTTCLNNYSSDNFQTKLGLMHVRLLGSLQERYIALGAADESVRNQLDKCSSEEIEALLKEAFLTLKDPREPDFNGFTEVSKTPIQIRLDYRKETIKLLEGSNTIVTVEGDAARKTTFFSGSGLNSAYKGLKILFNFCQTHAHLIFHNPNLLHIDQILLEKDKGSLEVSLELLKKGIKFILTPCQLNTTACSS